MIEYLMTVTANDGRPWVEVLVYPMAETHEPERVILVLGFCDVLGDVAGITDFVEHVEHGFVGAAVGGTPERGDAGGNRGIRVGAGGTGHAHGRSGSILFVVGVQD